MEIGKTYLDRVGEYEVLEIKAGRVRFSYLHQGKDSWTWGSLETKTQIHQSICGEKVRSTPHYFSSVQDHELFVRALLAGPFSLSISCDYQSFHRVEQELQGRGYRATGIIQHSSSRLHTNYQVSAPESLAEFVPDSISFFKVDNPCHGLTHRLSCKEIVFDLLGRGFCLGYHNIKERS